jgi:hypothetical protein
MRGIIICFPYQIFLGGIKLKNIRWTWNVSRLVQKINARRFFFLKNVKGGGLLEDLDVGGKIILKFI